MPSSAYERLDKARALLRTLTHALAAVAVLALTFTAVNVTQLAVRHEVPWYLRGLMLEGRQRSIRTMAGRLPDGPRARQAAPTRNP